MGWRVLWLAGLLAACGSKKDSTPPVNPPGPVVELALPPEVLAALPTLPDGGPPVLIAVPDGKGGAAMLIYDETKDDPITRWGDCVSRVSSCISANHGQPIAGCVAQIRRCADSRGGRDCCPPACIERFLQLVANGDEEAALVQSILAGTCVEGFVEPPTADGGGL